MQEGVETDKEKDMHEGTEDEDKKDAHGGAEDTLPSFSPSLSEYHTPPRHTSLCHSGTA